MYLNLLNFLSSETKHEKVLKRILLFVILLFPIILKAQVVSPEGKFLQDSMKVGEEIPFSLFIRYPADQTIVFPDSNFNFGPFELVDKTYTYTVSRDGFSFDSVIYSLRSFDLSPLQRLRLPVYLIENGDSVQVYSQYDTVYLNQMEISKDAPLKETTAYREVDFQFNYPYLVFGLLIFFIILVLVLIFYGKEIRKKIILYRLRKTHEKFVATYEDMIHKISGPEAKHHSEHALNYWKKYMEKIEKIPYTKLTTKEITAFNNDYNFHSTLKSIDKNIYGRFNPLDINAGLVELKEVANIKYEEKVEEVKNK